jgi:penicillin-binding protein 2
MLLMAAFSLAGAGMAVQMARLGVVNAEKSLEEAQRRLYRQRWVPTVRGRILDRHGRVLAQNRPSYEVAIDYQVLSGEWAEARAVRHARAVHGKAWPLLSNEQQEAVVARFLPLYEEHVREMERRLAWVLGIDEPAFQGRKARIIELVEGTARAVADERIKKYRLEQLERGKELTPELEALLQERAEQPIAAQREPQVLGDVPDATAFELIRLLDTFTELQSDEERVVGEAGEARANVDPVPLLPGVVVRRSEERQYPYDRMEVTLARDTFPTTIRDDTAMTLEIEGVAAHLIGWMGDRPLKPDTLRRAAELEADPLLGERAMVETLDSAKGPDGKLKKLDRGRYLDGDSVGRSGVEWSQEATLRGLRGLHTERLDIGERNTIDPEPGRDVHLTIDINLQARVQGLLDPRLGLAQIQPYHWPEAEMPVGTPLAGAAVVLDVDSGEVLALVTSPSFSRQTMREDPMSIFDDELNTAWVNRAIAKPYPPGSIMKPVTLTGAVTHGNYREGERIACTGHLLPNRPDLLRCWIYRPQFGMTTHSAQLGHDLNGVEAITVSCNIFFYTLGRRMGPTTLTGVFREFGVGTPWNLGVGMEFPGQMGGRTAVEVPELDGDGQPIIKDGQPVLRTEYVYRNDGADLTEFDTTLMGMGQGPIAWTPLHAAAAYATLARMGVVIEPRVINDGMPPQVHETSFDRRGIQLALAGIEGVVNDRAHGTAEHLTLETGREPIFNTPGIHVWGKSGTAQAEPLTLKDAPLDENGQEIPVRWGEHAWFTALVGREGDRPRYAISVIMEHAGSGGRASGTIVNQIIRALVAEGYL